MKFFQVEPKDTNTSTLASWLNSLGVEVKEVRVIPDIKETIIKTVNEFRKKFNYVFTTGGIGPTHDDITAESVSSAFNIEYDFHKEAYSILEKYYKPGEFNEGRQKMAKMPVSASLIYNPTSGAPGFSVENVYCLPGVPSILQSMLGGLKNKIVGGDPILSKTINLRTVESEIAKSLTEVQNKNLDVEIYISISEEIKKNCFNLSVLKSKINDLSAFNFEKIYNMGECTNSNVTEFLGWQSGGRIEFYKDLLLLTVGDFRNRSHPQNNNSLFGKLLAIDLNTNKTSLVSKP